MKCGITAENHFHCCDFEEWLILEIVVMSAFFAMLALGILLHMLHPVHIMCDIFKPPLAPAVISLIYYIPCVLSNSIIPPFLGPIPVGRKKRS